MTEHKEGKPKKEKLYTVEIPPTKNFGNNDFLHSNFLYLGDVELVKHSMEEALSEIKSYKID